MNWAELGERLAGRRLVFSIDVAKDDFYAALMTAEDAVEALVKWVHFRGMIVIDLRKAMPDAAVLLPIGMALAIGALTLVYGFQYRIGPEDRLWWYGSGTAVFLVGMAFLAVYGWRLGQGGLPMSATAGKVAFGVAALSFAYTLYFLGPGAQVWIFGLPLFALAGWVAARGKTLWAVRLLFGGALAFYGYLAVVMPLDREAADMLTIVQAAAGSFLDGASPYGQVFPDASVFPFVYLPGTWLPYVPLVAAGLDPRLLNLAALIVVALLAERASGGSANEGRELAAGVYPLLLSPMVAQILVYGQVWPYWMLTALLALLTLRGRYLWAAFVLGLMMATRQWAVFFAWPLAVAFALQLPLRRFLTLGALAALGYALPILPILALDHDLFYYAYVLPATFANDSPERTALRQVSLLPFLDLANLDRSALLIQACAAILVGALVSYVRSWAVPAVLYLTGLQYVAMLTISPQTFRYYYVSGLLLLAIAAAAQGGVGRPSGGGWPAASRIRDS